MNTPTRRHLSIDDYAAGIRNRDRAVLGRAISLIESSAQRHRKPAHELLERLMPHTGQSIRIGITGVPGAGKSTFIERLGQLITDEGSSVAVLAVDPSSDRTGGSILGDKTRMAQLALNDRAFIRPSPSAGTLGGVASKTRESLLVCEAAGFDAIIIETVGVGQSESIVANMTDVFLGLFIPNAGDELQGIKRGLLEMLDIIAVNKADGANRNAAKAAAQQLEQTTRFTHPDDPPPVFTCSARTGHNIDTIWKAIKDQHTRATANGTLAIRRRAQAITWMWSIIDEQLRTTFRADPSVHTLIPETERLVREGALPATRAAESLLEAFAERRS